MKNSSHVSQRGVALVTTVIVVAVLAVVAVAFMQSTSTDRLSSRTVANYFKAQLAAKAGLAEAMALIQQGTPNFRYISGAEVQGDGYRTYIRPLKAGTAVWEFEGDAIYLDSGEGADGGAELVLTGSLDEPGLTRSAAWKDIPLENAGPNETKRYAFWVDDASGKQNISWWGGGGNRGVIAEIADLPLVLPGADGSETEAFPPSALDALGELRSYTDDSFELADKTFETRRADIALPSVASFNLVAPDLGEGVFERYFFTMNSSSGAVTPDGKAKLNFAALREFLSGLTTDQGKSPDYDPDTPLRADLVEELLKESPHEPERWGGGSLFWLTTLKAEAGEGEPKYTPAEQRQIVANIIDYLDDDIIPTTDSTSSPTYFGVEYKLYDDGTVRGHPYINMIGTGSVFNWRTNNPASEPDTKGRLNSTRLLAFLGLVNPWSSALPVGIYTPEISFEVEGQVTGGTLGTNASAYFQLVLNEELDTTPVDELDPNSGATFPGPASGNNYASVKSFIEGGGSGQPPGIQFKDIVYRIASLKLKFESDDGVPGYVQIMPAVSVTMDPASVAFRDKTPDVYKFTRDSPDQKDLHLSGDPRANFAPSVWVNANSSGGTSSNIPTPASDIDVLEGAGPESDGAQGMATGSDWYASPAVQNHFSRLSRSGMETIGELGYIWTGKPWQTLNLLNVDSPETADWNFLDYVSTGTLIGGKATPVLALKAVSAGENDALANSLLASGGFNVNSRKDATWVAALTNAPGLTQEAAEAVLGLPSGSQASAFGEIAALLDENPELLKDAGDKKFAKEAIQRALANVAVNHSRVFTVYSAGEYRVGNSVSRAQLEADVFVGVNPATGEPLIQVIDQRFR